MEINHGNVKTRNSALELNSVVMDGQIAMMVQMSVVALILVVKNWVLVELCFQNLTKEWMAAQFTTGTFILILVWSGPLSPARSIESILVQ